MLSKPRFLAVGVVLVSLWIFVGSMRMENFESGLDEHAEWKEDTRIERWSKEEFISQAMSSAIQDDFDYGYIAQMCEEQQWDDSIVFECQNLIGGIGEIPSEPSYDSTLTENREFKAGDTALHTLCD